MATHCSILASRISWTEELGRLQSMGSQRIGHNYATNFHFIFITESLCCIPETNTTLYINHTSVKERTLKDQKKINFCLHKEPYKQNFIICTLFFRSFIHTRHKSLLGLWARHGTRHCTEKNAAYKTKYLLSLGWGWNWNKNECIIYENSEETENRAKWWSRRGWQSGNTSLIGAT